MPRKALLHGASGLFLDSGIQNSTENFKIFAEDLDRPVLRDLLSPILKLRAFAILLLYPLQRFKQFCKIQIKTVRDHTRGLLEAEASVALSATQFLENGFLLVAHWH